MHNLDETTIVLLLALILFGAYAVQAMSGFGAVVLAVTFGALLMPIRQLPPILVPLNVLLVTYLVARYYKTIDLRVLLLRILPLMGVGVVVGVYLFDYLPTEIDLKPWFAGLIILLSVLELIRLLKNLERVPVVDLVPGPVWMFLSGITHGLFASGGPLLVYAVNRLSLDKATFRSTLSAVWLVMNVSLTIFYLLSGHTSPERVAGLVVFLPSIVLGTVLGEYLHHRAPEHQFRIIVSVILLCAGVALLLR